MSLQCGTRQNGVVLLSLVSILLMAGVLFSASLYSHQNARLISERQARESLVAAKTALIAFAVNYADNYGHLSRGGTGRLPCPAEQPFSSPRTSCKSDAAGFLPTLWKRDGKLMDIDYLERFLDRDMWYAVAADYRFNPSYNALNSGSDSGLLSVNGIDDVVAVIIDPGPAREGQRGLRPGVSISAYLEGENSDGDLEFQIDEPQSNDRMIWIRRDELLPLVERRVLGQVRDWLAEYKNRFGRYPFASVLGDPNGECVDGLAHGHLSMREGNCNQLAFGDFVAANIPQDRKLNETWFGRNQWQRYFYYQVESNCIGEAASTKCDGVLDDQNELSVNQIPLDVLLVSAGREIESVLTGDMQRRDDDSGNRLEYFESSQLVEWRLEYQLDKMITGNDQWLTIPQVVQ